MKRKGKLIFIAFGLVGLAIFFFVMQNNEAKEEDVYANGLIYSRKTGALFSGTVKYGDAQHWGRYSYLKGEPNGHFESRDFGEVITEGEYLDKTKLPADLQKIIGNKVFAVSLWNEGIYDSRSPMVLTIKILEPDWGTFNFKNYQKMDSIAWNTAKITRYLNYNYLEIRYVSDFGIDVVYWYNVEYSMKGGTPVFDRRDSL